MRAMILALAVAGCGGAAAAPPAIEKTVGDVTVRIVQSEARGEDAGIGRFGDDPGFEGRGPALLVRSLSIQVDGAEVALGSGAWLDLAFVNADSIEVASTAGGGLVRFTGGRPGSASENYRAEISFVRTPAGPFAIRRTVCSEPVELCDTTYFAESRLID